MNSMNKLQTDKNPRQKSAVLLRSPRPRQANARDLLHLLRRHSPCSKADLVRFSGFGGRTVSSTISRWKSLGLVASIGESESSGGHPSELLRFNASHGFVAAADIGGTRLRMLMADFNGTVVSHWSTVLLRQQKTPDGVCVLIREGLKQMCRENKISTRKLLRLSVGAPGITDSRGGVVLAAPNLKDWNEVPLRDMLQAKTGLPVTVENDTNLAAVGEHWRGVAQGIENFVFIALGTGIGAGIFLRGELHHGAHWCAGEIGYLGVSGTKRERMQIREAGQLERIIGGAGIEERWREILRATSSPVHERRAKLHATQIFDLARDGDTLALEVLMYTANPLADAIADVSLLLNPELIVLGGGVGSHPELCRITEAILQRHEFARPQLRSSSLGTQAQLFGAISLAIAESEARLLL